MKTNKPNVVLICCDHLRADWLGCNGHPIVMTPQIDQLANEGVNFHRTFSECPVCVPARRIMMTGKSPYSIHMNQNKDEQPFPEGPKLAEVMTRKGYQTFASGKLHTCPQRNRIGFEEVQLNEEGRRQGSLIKDDYETFLAEQGYSNMAYIHGLGNNQYGMRISPLPEQLTTTYWTVQKAMEFIERRDPTRPFFMHVSFDKPHPPISPVQSYYDLYRDVKMPLPVFGNWEKDKLPSRIKYLREVHNYDSYREHPLVIEQSLKGFAAMITHIDSMIGNLLGTLRENKLLENTIIMITSDHGDQLFDHGNLAKGDFFRGSTNVPLIIRLPRNISEKFGIKRGITNKKNAVGLMDIMPTILEMCDVEIESPIEGRSLVPIMKDDSIEFRSHICGNFMTVYGISDGQYKYMWFSEDDYEYLFDLENDPNDCFDLSNKPSHKQVLELFRRRLVDWLEKNNDSHVEKNKLCSIPYKWKIDEAKNINEWNNRGRH